jgi:hypothetical protein
MSAQYFLVCSEDCCRRVRLTGCKNHAPIRAAVNANTIPPGNADLVKVLLDQRAEMGSLPNYSV